MQKKLLSLVLAIVIASFTLVGCGKSSPNNNPQPAKANGTEANNNAAVKENNSSNNNENNSTNSNTNTNSNNNNSNNNRNSNNNNNNNSNNSQPSANNSSRSSSSQKNNQQKAIQVPVTIINGTDVEFAKLYASSTTLDDWGSNLINGGSFPPGYEIKATFGVDANNLLWDFKAVDLYGDYLEFDGLDLSDCDVSGVTITLSYDRQTHTGRISVN